MPKPDDEGKIVKILEDQLSEFYEIPLECRSNKNKDSVSCIRALNFFFASSYLPSFDHIKTLENSYYVIKSPKEVVGILIFKNRTKASTVFNKFQNLHFIAPIVQIDIFFEKWREHFEIQKFTNPITIYQNKLCLDSKTTNHLSQKEIKNNHLLKEISWKTEFNYLERFHIFPKEYVSSSKTVPPSAVFSKTFFFKCKKLFKLKNLHFLKKIMFYRIPDYPIIYGLLCFSKKLKMDSIFAKQPQLQHLTPMSNQKELLKHTFFSNMVIWENRNINEVGDESSIKTCEDEKSIEICEDRNKIPICEDENKILMCQSEKKLPICEDENKMPICQDVNKIPICKDEKKYKVKCI